VTVYSHMSADETRGDPSDGDSSDAVPNDGNGESESTDDENDRFLDEGLIPLLVVGGLILFLFPEPVTSSLGIVLVGIGVGLWVWDLIS